MPLNAVIARLKDQCQGFRHIGGLADLDTADNLPSLPPAAYAIPLGETAHESPLVGDPRQWIEVDFAVILALANRRDASGTQALAELPDWRRQVRAALHLWQPDSDALWYPGSLATEPAQYRSGRLMRLTDGVLWWAEEFSIRIFC